MQYPCVIPADGMVLCPGVFSYGRFVFDASVLMLLQTCFESTSSLANVHFSAGAQYFVDNVWLLLHKEGVLDLSEEGESGPEHRLKSLHTLWSAHSRQPHKGGGQRVAYPPRCAAIGSRGRIRFHEVVLLLMHMVKTPYHTPLHVLDNET